MIPTKKSNYMRKSFWLICPINSPSFTLLGTTRIFTELYPNLVSWMRVIPTGRGGGGYRGRGSSRGDIGYSVDMREMKVMSRRTILDDARAGIMAIHNALDVYVRKVKRTLSIKTRLCSLYCSRAMSCIDSTLNTNIRLDIVIVIVNCHDHL